MGNLEAIGADRASPQAAGQHCRRVPRANRIHRVGLVTTGRHPHFGEWALAAEACRIMSASAHWQRSRLLAWVLLPDQWQGLVALGGFDDLAGCVIRLKARSARLLGAAQPGTGKGPLWASGYDALCVDDGLAAARRLVMRPVRTGLVQRIGDYPFWDAQWL